MRTPEEFVSFGQGNIEAFVKSSQIWAAGVQDISKRIAATAQEQFDATLSAYRALAGAKSIREAVDMQASLVRSTVEKAVTNGGQVAEAGLKLAEQTIAPIAERMQVAASQFRVA